MKTQHTKGEWTKKGVHGIENNEVVYIKQGESYIATVHSLFDGKNNLEKGIEAEANAKLIASAPELLDVLIKLSSHMNLTSNQYEMIEKAIKKATE